MAEKQELVGLSKSEIETLIADMGEKPFRAKQLWQWIYFHGETDFAKMSSFSKELRQKLADNFTITRPKIVAEQVSKDKTRKWLLEFKDGQRVEMVYIPEEDRGAVCISTQVGRLCGRLPLLPYRRARLSASLWLRATHMTSGRVQPMKPAICQILWLWAWVSLYIIKKM